MPATAAKANRVSKPRRPAFLRNRTLGTRTISLKDHSTGPVLLPTECELFHRLYHEFCPGKVPDWVGMCKQWNEHAINQAVTSGGYHSYKLKTVPHLKAYEKHLVQQSSLHLLVQHHNVLNGTAFQMQPATLASSDVPSDPANSAPNQEPKLSLGHGPLARGQGRGGAGGQRECPSCTAVNPAGSVPRKGHCCRCFMMSIGKAGSIRQAMVDKCLNRAKRVRPGSREGCPEQFAKLVSIKECLSSK